MGFRLGDEVKLVIKENLHQYSHLQNSIVKIASKEVCVMTSNGPKLGFFISGYLVPEGTFAAKYELVKLYPRFNEDILSKILNVRGREDICPPFKQRISSTN